MPLPQMTVEEVLRSTSNEALLTTFASLTHRIHAVEAKRLRAQGVTVDNVAPAEDLRARRAVVQQEILRRMA